MKKNEFRAGSKIINALCVIAIVVTIICQFMPYWSYTGITVNKELGEKRVVQMESSVAGYCWMPESETSDALEEYIKDPTVYYVEEVEVVKYDEEELEAVKGAVAALDEEPVEEEAAEEATDEAAAEETAEEATDEAATEETAEEATDEAAAEETAEEATDEAAAEETAEEEAVVEEDAGEIELIEGMLVTIKAYEKDAADVTEADKLVKETYKGMDENKFVNTLTGLPVIAFVVSIICIALACFMFKKAYIPAVLAIVAGAFHWVTYFTQPIFQLSVKWNSFLTTSLIVALFGALMLVVDIRKALQEKKAAKAEAELQESVEA